MLRGLADSAFLLVVGCAGIAVYTWVLVEPRYIAPFLTLLWVGAFSAIWLPRLPQFAHAGKAVVLAAVIVMAIVAGESVFSGASTQAGWHASRDVNWEVAEGLRRMGIREGDSVAVFGTPLRGYYWARLARVRVVVEMPSDALPDFWAASPSVKAKAIEALLSTDARGIVAAGIVETSGLDGWKRIGTTEFFLYPNPR